MSAYYNENDKFAAAWLRELIKAGHIADGVVDERSIADVRPDDLSVFTQCHFFAGIGGWSYALRLAGWPDDKEVWTGSCPCQPFSSSGKGHGEEDARHLWPVWFPLIKERRPAIVFGEQVAKSAGLQWLDLVLPDLEDENYATAAADLCAASVGAPHGRPRLYWVAHTESQHGRLPIQQRGSQQESAESKRRGETGALGNGNGNGWERNIKTSVQSTRRRQEGRTLERASVSPWTDCEWVECRDGKARPIEPGTFPLADGVSGVVARLRGFGNAIVPQVAQSFIEAYMSI